MIQKRIYKNSLTDLIQDVLIITLTATLFLIVVSKFGGYFADYLTETSCKAIDEKYVDGEKPGDGMCIKSIDNIDIKIEN